jgi:hypothetical protein
LELSVREVSRDQKPAYQAVASTTPGDVSQSLGSDYYQLNTSSVQRLRAGTKKLGRSDILQLQRTIGNQAVGKLLSSMKANPTLLQRAGLNDAEAQEVSGAASSAKDFWKKSESSSSNPSTAPGTAEPKVEVKPGPKFDMVATASKIPQWDTLKSRLEERDLGNPEILKLSAEYVLAMTVNQVSKAKYVLNLLNDRFKGLRAFATKKGDNQEKDYSGKFNLWSGAKEQAMEHSIKTGGIALEASKVGSVFDGLNFGMQWNASLGHQWNEYSRLYAEGITGEVHIHQYRGVREGSVFNKVEYPVIKDGIAMGTIEPVIHLYSNWGKFQKLNYGAPVYGSSPGDAGEKSRKKETEIKGVGGLNTFLANKWEFGDAVEKQGGYWKPGTAGDKKPWGDNNAEVFEGTEW